jgi:carbon monoxide dehydrogenase subunit G
VTDGRCTESDVASSWRPGELMAPVTTTIDIARPQDEVFAYVTDPTRFGEWQQGVVGGGMEAGATPAVGALCTTTRRIGGAERRSTSRITELDPPSRWAVHGIDGPIRASVSVSVEPLDAGKGSRVTIEVDFEGHGIGKVLIPLIVARQARNEMPANSRLLKRRLEASATSTDL